MVTITVDASGPQAQPVVYREQQIQPAQPATPHEPLEERERDVLVLAHELGAIGPTEINQSLGISLSTAYRILGKLEQRGLLQTNDKRKRVLTTQGSAALNEKG